jgi:hypothetical protein
MQDVYRVGESKRLAHSVTSPDGTAFVVSAVVITLYPPTGTPITGAGTADPGTSAISQEVYYNWTPTVVGDYSYLLSYTVGAQTIDIRGAVSVLPAASLYETKGYFQRVLRALAEADVDEGQMDLAARDLMDALAVSVLAYSQKYPRLLQRDVSLDGATWEFPLAYDVDAGTGLPGWLDEYSAIQRIEPRVDATQQYRITLPLGQWEIDLRRGVWRFLYYRGSSGDVARLDYTGLHTLSHTVDTLPAQAFEPICRYAAAHLCEGPKATRAAGTEAPEQGAGLVSRRDQTARFQAQADRLRKEALRLWKRRVFAC